MSGQVQRRNAQMVELQRSDFVSSPWGCTFLAFNSVTDEKQTGAGATPTINFDTEVYDVGDDFAGDTFTAPADGAYPLTAKVEIEGLTAAMTTGRITLNTNNRTYSGPRGDWGGMRDNGNRFGVMISAIADMAAGHVATVTITISNGAGNDAGIRGHATVLYTYFCGHRVI